MIALDSMLFLSYESDEGERRERKFSLFSPSPLSRSEINMAANVESLRQNNPEPRTGGSLGCAPGCDAGGREFVTPTGPTLRVFK